MFDFETRKITEALRSGVPSKAIGRYFSEARPKLMKDLSDRLNNITAGGSSEGIIISGKYGEGKTHLLNTLFSMAHDNNMVVSLIPLGKETPMDKLQFVYQKIIANTYLPGREQPGFTWLLEEMAAGNSVTNEMLLFASRETETDKLYYVLKSYFSTDDMEDKYRLKADIEGDFINNGELKKIYRRITGTPAKFNQPFRKTKNLMDYFEFLSHFFKTMGYAGWVILFDEAELTGRLGKKARLRAYRNMAEFLFPNKKMESVFSVFAVSASYAEDVIDAKHEYENLAEIYPDEQEPMKSVLDRIIRARQLEPLTRQEMDVILGEIKEYHALAYDWIPQVSQEELTKAANSGGFLLRTKIRAAIEYLDQIYLYRTSGKVEVSDLSVESYDEDILPLEALSADED